MNTPRFLRSRFVVALFPLLSPWTPGLAEPVALARIEDVAPSGREAWRAYLARSGDLARADRGATEAELRALGLAAPVRAPSGGDC